MCVGEGGEGVGQVTFLLILIRTFYLRLRGHFNLHVCIHFAFASYSKIEIKFQKSA